MAAPLKAPVDPLTGEILETPELRAEGLAQLRAAIAADQAQAPGWKTVRDDDVFYLAFLRARKFEVLRTLPVVRSFSQFWYANPSLINGRECLRAPSATANSQPRSHPPFFLQFARRA